ncbi:MAG: hypothetical protein KIT11_09910 [Fimbriimonadaceae bacterium]|nr:hypothetical protein [Fimbriimonadaceae bacterium]QYK55639.1 MAG: hypothetical protein KF733_11580 [Fimbriimonadaceae bacterium]
MAKERGYNATLFRRMLKQYRGLGTARKLLAADAPQYGLLRLKEIGLLAHSLENTVLNPKYADLFLTREKETARERSQSFGFTPEWRQDPL